MKTPIYEKTFRRQAARLTDSAKLDSKNWQLAQKNFEDNMYAASIHSLISYIQPNSAMYKYVELDNTYKIYHGQSIIYLSLGESNLHIKCSILRAQSDYVVPLLRQVCEFNFMNTQLITTTLDKGVIELKYTCQLEEAEPQKIYHVLEEICIAVDDYTPILAVKFKSDDCFNTDINEYEVSEKEKIHTAFLQYLAEANNLSANFESLKDTKLLVDALYCTILKMLGLATYRGKLYYTLNNALEVYDDKTLDASFKKEKIQEIFSIIQKISLDDFMGQLIVRPIFINSSSDLELSIFSENIKIVLKNAEEAYENGRFVFSFYILYRFLLFSSVCQVLPEDLSHKVESIMNKVGEMEWKAGSVLLREELSNIDTKKKWLKKVSLFKKSFFKRGA